MLYVLVGIISGLAALAFEKLYYRWRLRHMAKKELVEWEKAKGAEKKDPPDVIHGC